MKTIVLHGYLAVKYGKRFEASVKSAADVIRLLGCNFAGFVDDIKDKWFVITTSHNKTGTPQELLEMETGCNEIHVRPLVTGKFKGLFALFFGLPLLGEVFAPITAGLGAGGAGAAGAAGFLGFGGAAGGFGSILLGITILGVGYLITSALAPKNKNDREQPDEKASFIFDGAVNNVEQGGPVPLVYGLVRTGSTVVSGSLTVEDVAAT